MQRTAAGFGKELMRESRFLNHHHFNLRCQKSGIIPPSLQIKSPVNTERARSAAARALKIFLQERVKTTWRAGNSAKTKVENNRKVLQATLSSEDFNKVISISTRKAEKTFLKFKQWQIEIFRKLKIGLSEFSRAHEVELRPSWLVNFLKKKI